MAKKNGSGKKSWTEVEIEAKDGSAVHTAVRVKVCNHLREKGECPVGYSCELEADEIDYSGLLKS